MVHGIVRGVCNGQLPVAAAVVGWLFRRTLHPRPLLGGGIELFPPLILIEVVRSRSSRPFGMVEVVVGAQPRVAEIGAFPKLFRRTPIRPERSIADHQPVARPVGDFGLGGEPVFVEVPALRARPVVAAYADGEVDLVVFRRRGQRPWVVGSFDFWLPFSGGDAPAG